MVGVFGQLLWLLVFLFFFSFFFFLHYCYLVASQMLKYIVLEWDFGCCVFFFSFTNNVIWQLHKMLRFWVGVLVSFSFWLPILLIGNYGGYECCFRSHTKMHLVWNTGCGCHLNVDKVKANSLFGPFACKPMVSSLLCFSIANYS